MFLIQLVKNIDEKAKEKRCVLSFMFSDESKYLLKIKLDKDVNCKQSQDSSNSIHVVCN
jgi:hypothetical protein